jgi:capsular exopolysaccharide synthesis family protein
MSDQITPKGDSKAGKYPSVLVERRNSGLTGPKPPEAEVSFVEIRNTLRRRKGFILASVVGIFALAVAYVLIATPKYKATSMIEYNLENADVVSTEDTRVATETPDALVYHVTQETQILALQSDTLALQVAQELNLEGRKEFTRNQSLLDYFRTFPDESKLPLEKAPHRRHNILKAFEKNLTVKAVPGSRLIEISFFNPDAQLAPKIVNALVNDFQDQQFRIRYAATAQVSDWLTGQLKDLKKQLEGSQEQLAQYQKQAGILGADETHNIVMTRLEEADRQLASAESNRILAQTVWQLARSGNPELISGLVGPAASAPSAGEPNALALIENLRMQQSQLKVEYAQAATKYGSDYPRLVQLKSQMSELDEFIKTEVQNLGSRAQNDYMAARQTEDAARGSFEVAKADANKLNDNAVQYTILRHEVESKRTLYDSLSKQLKEAGIMANLRPTNIVTVDPARPADRPAKPSIPLYLAASLFGGLLVGVGGAFALENLDETITSPDQAEQLSLVPSIGLVPRSKLLSDKSRLLLLKGRPTAQSRILVAYQPHSQVAEAFRTLRTSILQMTRSSGSNVLLFTSALPGEGKTVTSLNCAAALAQQGSKVLLVEADMRRPNLSAKLGLTGTTALSSMISSGDAPAPPLRLPSLPNLSIIPAGPKPQYPAELLGSPRMAELIQAWRAEYSYVVIDTPPVLAVTDASVISSYCDAVVLVVRSGVTRRQSLLRVRDLFVRAQTRIAGIVINAFDLESPEYARYFGCESTPKNGKGYYIPETN